MIDNSGCEGCGTYNVCIRKELPENYCPCKLCIIKGICIYICHSYHEYWMNIKINNQQKDWSNK